FLALLSFLLLLLEALLLLAALLLEALLLEPFLLLVVGGLEVIERGVGFLRVLAHLLGLLPEALEERRDERTCHHGVPEAGEAVGIERGEEEVRILEHALCSGERIGRVPLDRRGHLIHR